EPIHGGARAPGCGARFLETRRGQKGGGRELAAFADRRPRHGDRRDERGQSKSEDSDGGENVSEHRASGTDEDTTRGGYGNGQRIRSPLHGVGRRRRRRAQVVEDRIDGGGERDVVGCGDVPGGVRPRSDPGYPPAT